MAKETRYILIFLLLDGKLPKGDRFDKTPWHGV